MTQHNPYGYSRLVCECRTCGKKWLCINNSDAEMRKSYHEAGRKDHLCDIFMEQVDG